MSIVTYELNGRIYSYEDSEYFLDTQTNRLRFIGWDNIKSVFKPAQPKGYTSYHSIFYNCLTRNQTLNLSDWDMSEATDLSFMFCSFKGSHISGIYKWDVSNVIYMNHMFANCINLQKISITNWNIHNVIDISYIFFNCYNISIENGIENLFCNKDINYSFAFHNAPMKLFYNFPKWYKIKDKEKIHFLYNKIDETLYIMILVNYYNEIQTIYGKFYDGLKELVCDIIDIKYNILPLEYNLYLAKKLGEYFINNNFNCSEFGKPSYKNKYLCIEIPKNELINLYKSKPEEFFYKDSTIKENIISIQKPIKSESFIFIDILMNSNLSKEEIKQFYLDNKKEILNKVKDTYSKFNEKKSNKSLSLNYYKIGSIQISNSILRFVLELKEPLLEMENEFQDTH